MTSYESMRSKLLPLGLYRLAQGDVTDSELKAYAEGLDILFDALDEMERESFIPTAQSYGLSEREKFIFKETPELTVEESLTEYKTSKGAIQLPNNRDLPLRLIADIARWSYKKNRYEPKFIAVFLLIELLLTPCRQSRRAPSFLLRFP